MAWPSYVVSGQVALANQYNAIVDALATWGGGVDAGGYGIKNLASLTYAPNAVMDASAGGFQFHGAAVISATDNAPLTVQNGSTGVSLQLYTGGGALNPQIHSSTGLTVFTSQDATITRGIVLNAASGKQESITTTSGRLTIPALDVTADITATTISAGAVTLTGNLRVASLTVTGTASIASLTVTGGITVAGGVSVTGDLNIGGTLGTSRADGYLYIAPYVRASQIFAAGVSVASADWTKTAGFVWGGDNNPYITCNQAAATFIINPNTQVVGWLRTVGASGLYVYSPDFSRFLQISSANTGNPVITSSTAALTISANMTFTGVASFAGSVTVSPGNLSVSGQVAAGGRLTAGSDITVSASLTGTGYLQLCNNGQFNRANPWIFSSTGWLDIVTNTAFVNGVGWTIYNVGNTQYLSTLWSGGHPAFQSSTGQLVINNAATIQGTLTVSGATTHSGAMTTNGITNVSGYMDNSGGVALRSLNAAPIYWYNTSASAFGVLGWLGTSQPAINSSNGVIWMLAQTACIATGGFVVYSPDQSRYGQWNSANAGHPTIYSSTGTVVFTSAPYLSQVSCTVVPAASPAINVSMPATNMSGFQMSVPSVGNTTLVLGVSNAIFSGTQPYIYSNTGTLNIQANTLYVTGAVSATAHQTHGSGDNIEDIYRAFYRPPLLREESAGEDDDPLVAVLPGTPAPSPVAVNAWTLAPADDGLHILVKRSADEVVEFVLTWDQAKAVPPPADKAGV